VAIPGQAVSAAALGTSSVEDEHAPAQNALQDTSPPSDESAVPNTSDQASAAAEADQTKTRKKKRGRSKGSTNQRKSPRKGSGFIDLTGVPPQPPILKNQLGSTLYKSNFRPRPVREGSSKYTGVYFDAASSQRKAQIMVEGKVRSIGYYDNEDDAAADYARAAFKYKPRENPNKYGGLDLSEVPATLPLIRNEGTVTGFAGVKRNTKGRYEARISIQKKVRALGTYTTPEEAALVYARAKFYLDSRQNGQQGEAPSAQEESESRGTANAATLHLHGSNAGQEEVDDDPIDCCYINDLDTNQVAV